MSKIFFAQVFYISPDLEEHIFTTIYTANERLLSVSGGCCSIFARNSLFDGTNRTKHLFSATVPGNSYGEAALFTSLAKKIK